MTIWPVIRTARLASRADETRLKKAQESGLALSQQMSFNTMVFANDAAAGVCQSGGMTLIRCNGELEIDPPA